MDIYSPELAFYTYMYRDINNTPIYVGKGKDARAGKHFYAKTHLGNLLRKRLNAGFKIEPIFLCKDVDEEFAFFVEIEMIRHYGRKDLDTGTLFNLTDGGDGSSGNIPSKENLAKRSKALKGIPATGKNAKGIPKIGKGAKGVPKTGVNAKGVPATGKKAKGEPATGKSAKGVPKTGVNAKGVPKPIITCPHCNKSGGIGPMKQWHFDNCKFKLV